ncbi:MAG: DUF86 domain-containing protein [Myxococcota bacterium]|nr:DUF86 domain-containing protein [Myxococcota bacterium]
MLRDDGALLDMLGAARLVVDFRGSADKGGFLADPKTRSAVLHQLLILGEAAKRVSPAFRARHPEIPWKAMAGMRDRLIHGYDTVDLEEVWKAATVRVPQLIVLLEPLAPAEPPDAAENAGVGLKPPGKGKSS